jgi:hypothetical protein
MQQPAVTAKRPRKPRTKDPTRHGTMAARMSRPQVRLRITNADGAHPGPMASCVWALGLYVGAGVGETL